MSASGSKPYIARFQLQCFVVAGSRILVEEDLSVSKLPANTATGKDDVPKELEVSAALMAEVDDLALLLEKDSV